MHIFSEKQPLKVHLSKQKAQNKKIGFVPTMGALHQGHLSLIKKAQQKNDIVVVSIFVNPTQFDKEEDLTNYPKTLEKDIKLLKSVDCDALFHPSVREIYGDKTKSENFDFDGLENQMEGKFRKGHFDGVGTIVKTLFEIVAPDKAYFGEKDFQQLQIIKKMVKKHRLAIKIKGCKIFRENDGLAMSSRNTRLTTNQRKAAPFIYKTLKKAKKKFKTENSETVTKWVKNQFKTQNLLALEYFTIADEKTLKPLKNKESDKKYRAFIAVFAGEIRLIDNIGLKNN
jgi:pantoate--beta-alanine ligase